MNYFSSSKLTTSASNSLRFLRFLLTFVSFRLPFDNPYLRWGRAIRLHKQIMQIKHRMINENPKTSRRRTIWLLTSLTEEELNSRLPRNNSSNNHAELGIELGTSGADFKFGVKTALLNRIENR